MRHLRAMIGQRQSAIGQVHQIRTGIDTPAVPRSRVPDFYDRILRYPIECFAVMAHGETYIDEVTMMMIHRTKKELQRWVPWIPGEPIRVEIGCGFILSAGTKKYLRGRPVPKVIGLAPGYRPPSKVAPQVSDIFFRIRIPASYVLRIVKIPEQGIRQQRPTIPVRRDRPV